MNAKIEKIISEMDATRRATREMFDLVRESDLRESPGFGFRPLLWHLAHIGVFESYWILQRVKGEAAIDEKYERVFDPIKTPREQSKDLPSQAEMTNFLLKARGRVLNYLENLNDERADLFDAPLPCNQISAVDAESLLQGGYVFRLVLEHEQQHQETLAYLLQMLEPSKKTRPQTLCENLRNENLTNIETSQRQKMLTIPAGEFPLGADGKCFAYDNEFPMQSVFVPAFKIAASPVTNAEFAEFVNEGGYARREFWSDEGWRQREKDDWRHPLYWRRAGASWRVREMFGESALEEIAQHPVWGISWHEAEAYARFAGKRLPSEIEWEKAASWSEELRRKNRFAWGNTEPQTFDAKSNGEARAKVENETSANSVLNNSRAISTLHERRADLSSSERRANFGFQYWRTTSVAKFPAGASVLGCLDMNGNVWEWTSSAFCGYKNFRAFPYPEYSEAWFDGDHRVLKGGSWATRESVLRLTFRNFFRRGFRIAFAGLRLAEDV
jgi:iron(II)-dependent oxidoreductase